MRRSPAGWRAGGWTTRWTPARWRTRLEAGIPARTVLWLGELRQYADADGGAAVLGRLADLLAGEGHLVITTVWPEQWTAYTAAARAGPGAADPAGTAGRLLERLPDLTGADPAGIDPARGGVIDVPDQFTAADLDAAARTGDPVLAEAAAAAAAAGQGGQVTQYLAGVPTCWTAMPGPAVTPTGRRSSPRRWTPPGSATPARCPAALVQEAAVGYLTGPQRTTSPSTAGATPPWTGPPPSSTARCGPCSPSRPHPAPAWPATRSPTTSTSTAAAPARTSPARPPCGTPSPPTPPAPPT